MRDKSNIIVVLSGVNLVEGGPIKVFKDAIEAFAKSSGVEVVCLVHKKSLFDKLYKFNIKFIEFPEVKLSWFKRLWFEYYTSMSISREIKPDIWLSMHDMTPRVDVPVQFVYCHNPIPFYKSAHKMIKDKYYLFYLSYKWIYKINIKQNMAVIVQQGWLGEYLVNHLGAKDYIVSKPVTSFYADELVKTQFKSCSRVIFFYPALARIFKNFELILDAVVYLKDNYPKVYSTIEINLTIDSGMNKHAASIVSKYGDLESVNYLGVLSYDEVVSNYKNCDVVLFPSKLETWGLPISEAKEFAKPIILSDLPYAYETLGNYNAACFVDTDDYINLANKIITIVGGGNVFSKIIYEDSPAVVQTWSALVNKIKTISEEKSNSQLTTINLFKNE